MSIEKVSDYLRACGCDADIHRFEVSTATVQLAADALGIEPARIAKSIALHAETGALLVVAAGDAKVDNRKFKERFGLKPRMLSGPEVEAHTGYPPGGVCPFALPEGLPVYLDESLRRFDTVFPACGDANSAVRLTLPELETLSGAVGWVDVTKLPEQIKGDFS